TCTHIFSVLSLAAHWRKEPLASSTVPGSGAPRSSMPVSETPSGEPAAHAHYEVDGISMVRLLGPEDRLLRTVESQFPLVRVLVRGNEVTLDGDHEQVESAKRLVKELISMVRNGQDLGQPDVEA